jgi:hypothetical protein
MLDDRHDSASLSVSAERNAEVFIDLPRRRVDPPDGIFGDLVTTANAGVSQNFGYRFLRQPLRFDLDEPG